MYESLENTREHKIELTSAMMHALGDDDLDKAEDLLDNLQELNELDDEHPDVLTFRVMIAVQRGQALDALRLLNSLDEEHCPELRVLCLFFIEDPLWQGLAAHLVETSPDPDVRASMADLLATLTNTTPDPDDEEDDAIDYY
jgi:type III secretion protein HrpB1